VTFRGAALQRSCRLGRRVAGIARRSGRVGTRSAKTLLVVALAGALFIGGIGSVVSPAVAAATTMVDLGRASTYAVLSGASVGNTVSAVGAPHTTLRGHDIIRAKSNA
jgi:hypothetical protein